MEDTKDRDREEIMEVITIANQKGGVGKTTTAHTLAVGLYLKGHRVLIIDSDSQSNLTYTLDPKDSGYTLYDLLQGIPIDQVIAKSNQGIDIIAGDFRLIDSDSIKTATALKDSIAPIKKDYDFIIIDTPPTLSLMTINSLTASDSVIIPMRADIYSIQGLAHLIKQINLVRDKVNPELKVKGVLLTLYHDRTILNRKLYNTIKQATNQLKINLFKTTIREAVILRESQTAKSNIFKIAPYSNIAKDYNNFIKEILKERG